MRWLIVLFAVVATTACSADGAGTLSVYTSVTQGTVDSVVAGYSERFPDVSVEVFRAPTGELAARMADGHHRLLLLWDPIRKGRLIAHAVKEAAAVAIEAFHLFTVERA